jgi:DNA-directed RNA polymerase specialized sigma24 family protein
MPRVDSVTPFIRARWQVAVDGPAARRTETSEASGGTGAWEDVHVARGTSRACARGPGGRIGLAMSEPLRSEQLEALLQQLGPDRDLAGTQYEQLRRRLVAVFEYRRCHHPEELADETLDRVARKVQEMGPEFEGSDPARFVFGVAWNVARESFRRRSTVPLPDGWERMVPMAPKVDDDAREHACLDCCLEELAAPERDLILGYHEGDRSARIRRRSELAGELGLSANALRLKIHRLTDRLRECVGHCMDRGGRVGANGSPR